MKKLIILNIFIVVNIISTLIFSGCIESSQDESLRDKIILINENVVIPPIAGEETIVIYRGTIKNTADLTIDQLTVIVNFYDNNNTYLGSKSDLLTQIASEEQRNFQVQISNKDPFYKTIDHVAYEFEIQNKL